MTADGRELNHDIGVIGEVQESEIPHTIPQIIYINLRFPYTVTFYMLEVTTTGRARRGALSS